MPYTLAFRSEPVPGIPPVPADGGGEGRRPRDMPADRHEHFGTREAALGRAVEMLPAPQWRNLRLFGPDGRHIAGQAELERLVAAGGAVQSRR